MTPKRKQLNQTQILAIAIQQGGLIRCFRCREYLLDANDIDCEHILERALGGSDLPFNRAFSHKHDCHKRVTNGTKATSAGSSKHKIKKVKRLEAVLVADAARRARAAADIPEYLVPPSSFLLPKPVKAAPSKFKRRVPSRPLPKRKKPCGRPKLKPTSRSQFT